MKENLRKILGIASVALNVVFAATYATYKLPLLVGVHQPPAPRAPLFLQLDLRPDQLTQFNEERDRFRAQIQELGEQIKTREIGLIDLLGSIPPDQREIERKQKEIHRLQGLVQDRVIVHFLKGSALLTPEQRVRFLQLIKGRIETSIQACPPWMRSFERGQARESENQ
jgi:Spy/CpxP family protein refolding chaperone